MAKIIQFSKWIEDAQEQIYPRTHTNAVLLANGTALTAKLQELDDKVANAGLTEEEVTQLIKDEISLIVGENVDEAFDTLKEIADWIIEHGDEYENIVAMLGNKVDKEAGKGLSTNDYTNADKALVDSIAGLTTTVSNLTTEDVTPVTARQYVTQQEKTKIEASARVLVFDETFPSDAAETDLVIQILSTI